MLVHHLEGLHPLGDSSHTRSGRWMSMAGPIRPNVPVKGMCQSHSATARAELCGLMQLPSLIKCFCRQNVPNEPGALSTLLSWLETGSSQAWIDFRRSTNPNRPDRSHSPIVPEPRWTAVLAQPCERAEPDPACFGLELDAWAKLVPRRAARCSTSISISLTALCHMDPTKNAAIG